LAPAALPNFAQITALRGPAVVNISVSGMSKTALETGPGNGPGLDPSDPFFEFYRRFMPPGVHGMQPRNVPVHAQGSGFIVSADGIILTNAHVVQDAREVTVKLTDRREFSAKVLGADPKTDVAVLKIDASNLPTLPLGNTRDLQVGEWVLAIGSPFGFENSVSAGVVSAKGRSLPDDSFVPFIQTDVAVNPGNSGGPLFNSRGEVVGINSQIYSRTGGYQGLSFAIPIEVASRVRDQIVATGRASHARLGVSVQEVNQTLADSFKLDKPAGALVSGVESGGPGDKAGLKSGDIILKVGDQPVLSSGDLPAFIGNAVPGSKVTLEVWRQGKREQLSAQLGDASDKLAKTAAKGDNTDNGKLGLALRPLQPQEMRAAGVQQGLLVQDAAGAAAMAGVQPGDVVLAVNGTAVRSVDQVRSALAQSPKSVALLIQRDGEQLFVPVRIG
jgi:serine protease Do